MFKIINSNRVKSLKSSFSSISISSDPDTPGIPKFNENSENDSFDTKNVSFEDKYIILEPIIGEVSSSFLV
jgi:hypothetical protein